MQDLNIRDIIMLLQLILELLAALPSLESEVKAAIAEVNSKDSTGTKVAAIGALAGTIAGQAGSLVNTATGQTGNKTGS